jgi:surfactin synthase thioesterase subunit
MTQAAAANDTSDTWIRRYQPAPSAPAVLVCFPHAGGSASFYVPVARALAPDVDVLAVQYPGRQDRLRDACIDDIGALADACLPALVPWLDRPVALFGHSMGAVVAFEVAARLERDHRIVPQRLFASGRRAPSTHRDETVHLGDDGQLVAEIKKLSGTDTRLLGDDEVLQMIIPAIRSDYRAIERYSWRPGPALACPVSAFVGDDDPKATVEEVRAWAAHTTGRFDLQVFPGGHFYLTEHAPWVLREITERLSCITL